MNGMPLYFYRTPKGEKLLLINKDQKNGAWVAVVIEPLPAKLVLVESVEKCTWCGVLVH